MQLGGLWRVRDCSQDSLDRPDVPFERLVKDHSPRLLAIARGIVGRRFSPEDVVQQALMNLYEHRRRYDWSEPLPLMRRAVVNEALRLLRKPSAGSIDPIDVGRDQPPDSAMLRDETVQQVRQAIDRLPDHFRAALVLCEYEGMSYPEIAQELGITLQQTKTWIFRGRRQLEGMLSEFVRSGRALK